MSQIPQQNRIENAALLNSAFYLAKLMQSSKNANYYAHHDYEYANYRHGTIPSSHNIHQRSFLDTISSFIKQVLYVTLCAFLLLSTSVAWYSLIYKAIMPKQYATETIYFNYNSQESCTAMNSRVCPATAVVDLVSPNTQWKAHIPDVISDDNDWMEHTIHGVAFDSDEEGGDVDGEDDDDRHSSTNWYSKRILVPKKSYFVQVALTLPESTNNRDVGMFMVEMDLKSQNKQSYNNYLHSSTFNVTNSRMRQPFKLLASSSRPAMLPYQSTYVSLVKKTFIMIPLILGAIPEARTVIVECFDRFRESESYPMNLVEIRLIIPYQPVLLSNNHDNVMEWKHVQIWKAELRIGKELNHIQCLMREWFYSFAFMGIGFIMGLQMVLWFTCKLAWDRKRTISVTKSNGSDRAGVRDNRHRNRNGRNMGHEKDDDFDNLSFSSASSVNVKIIIDDDDDDHDEDNYNFNVDNDNVVVDDDGDHVRMRKGRGHLFSSVHSPSSMVHEDENGEDCDSDLWEPLISTQCDANREIPKVKLRQGDDGKDNNTRIHHHGNDWNKTNPYGGKNHDHPNGQVASNEKHHVSKSNPDGKNNQSNNDNKQKDVGKNQKKKYSKRKKMKLSSNKSELRLNRKSKHSEEDERIMAERVMKGDIEPFEIFTGEHLIIYHF